MFLRIHNLLIGVSPVFHKPSVGGWMIQLDFYGTLVAASLVLLMGRSLVNRISFLRTYNIPKPVAGGLLPP